MTSYRLVSSETKPLTAEMVAEHRGLPPSPTERVLDEKRVDFLDGRLKAGLFHPPHWVQAIVAGKRMRANGMHSSTMLSKLNGDLPAGLMVHLDVFECPDLDSLALLFRQFDDRRSARTPADVSGAYQGLRVELHDVPREVAKQGAEAIAWFRTVVRGEKDTPTGDDRYTVFNRESEHAFLRWLGEIANPNFPKEMRGRAPVIAAMYATFTTDQDAANDFWREVIQGGRDYEEEWPTTVLSDGLRRIRTKEFDVKPKGIYQGCIYAWNAMRDGKSSLKDIRWDIKKSFHRVL